MPTSQISHICCVVYLVYIVAKCEHCEGKYDSAGKGSAHADSFGEFGFIMTVIQGTFHFSFVTPESFLF